LLASSSFNDVIVDSLDAGANDYILAPFQQLELIYRISTLLSNRKNFRSYIDAKQNQLILQEVFPDHVIRNFKSGNTCFTETHEQVVILFCDICSFTDLSSTWPIEKTVQMLNKMFSSFDEATLVHNVFKVETIGDAYMIVCGHELDKGTIKTKTNSKNVKTMIKVGLDMLSIVALMNGQYEGKLDVRIGIHAGPAYSGIIGKVRPRYNFFGDTVNVASRMESSGFCGCLQISEAAYHHLPDCEKASFLKLESRHIKGKGLMGTYVHKQGRVQNIPSSLMFAKK
jgi:class 3 adenylate cyclase